MSVVALAVAATVAATSIDVRVLTKEHPRQVTLEGPRRVAAGVRGDSLQIDGVTVNGPYELPSGTWRLRVANGPAAEYVGTVLLTTDQGELAVVVRMEREVYVALAVAGETIPGTRAAALEAQAIVARSWAAAAGHRHADADVCDLAHCQVLRAGLPPTHLAAARRAAEATRGVVLLLGSGEVAMAPFHAACGGRTADPREVFGGDDRTGATSVEDPGCDGPQWRAEVSRDAIRRAAAETMRARSDVRNREIGVADLELVAGRGGWIKAVVDSATGASAYGDAFIRALGREVGWNVVRGGRFRWTSGASGDVVIRGAGLGHGVGLCQSGAARMAAAGASADEILRRFFPGLTLATPTVVSYKRY